MNTIMAFGEEVEGYTVPVLNEREVRAAAGILFLLMLVSIMIVILKEDFLLLKYASTMFLTDIVIRVFVSPRFSPTLIIGRLIVRNQVPEYVGAEPKKFAWIIGVILATTLFLHLVVMNSQGPIAGIICLICLVFLFFETAFGICLGCMVYPLVYKEKAKYCPGEVCDVKSKQDIQRASKTQLLVVAIFVAYIVLAVFLLNDTFQEKPRNLLGAHRTSQCDEQFIHGCV